MLAYPVEDWILSASRPWNGNSSTYDASTRAQGVSSSRSVSRIEEGYMLGASVNVCDSIPWECTDVVVRGSISATPALGGVLPGIKSGGP